MAYRTFPQSRAQGPPRPVPGHTVAPATAAALNPNDRVFEAVVKSIENAQSVMSKNKASLDKTMTNKETRNKIISKASGVVNALLDPAHQVANLLDGIGGVFPPCKVASNTLAAIVELEQNRRDNDVRVVVIHLEFSTLLATLGSLEPGFTRVQSLVQPLGQILDGIDQLMKEFGEFSERFYNSSLFKSRIRHLLFATSNKASLSDFRVKIDGFRAQLSHLLSQQAVLILADHTRVLDSIERKLTPFSRFYSSLTTDDELSAETFVAENGGEENVQTDDYLLDEFVQRFGESLSPGLKKIVQESIEDSYRQSQATFLLKFKFALESKIDDSQEAILLELKSGPHEAITDPDMKAIWKEISGKESSIKRRRFIDGMIYFFNLQFKRYRAEHGKADRPDAWTRRIISKVPYHAAIGDAIDDDASGYISVGEVQEFMHLKPAKWSTAEYIAYWAYGWDADNGYYNEQVNKILNQLQKICDEEGANATSVEHYLSEVKDKVIAITNSIYVLNTLEPTLEPKMNELRRQWRDITEKQIKQRLKTVNYKFEESTFTAIAGSQRVESTFFPFVYLLLLRHHALFTKGETSEEAMEEAINTINVLLDVVESRVAELKAIWRRQRIDLEIQVRYYANGMFEDYYKKYLKDNLDRQELSLPVTEDWDEDDEWSSEEEGGELADPDGAPLQSGQSDAGGEQVSSQRLHEDDEVEEAGPRADDEEQEYGRQQSTNDEEDDNGYHGRTRTGYGRRDDDDEGSDGGPYSTSQGDGENDGDEDDNYSRRQSRRQQGYDDDEDD
ncbi:unnamed protein product [Peniophora sp. CBMAI 1063]|nr:unnamed protein product [Peniophora sp. CBMAI 1063]